MSSMSPCVRSLAAINDVDTVAMAEAVVIVGIIVVLTAATPVAIMMMTRVIVAPAPWIAVMTPAMTVMIALVISALSIIVTIVALLMAAEDTIPMMTDPARLTAEAAVIVEIVVDCVALVVAGWMSHPLTVKDMLVAIVMPLNTLVMTSAHMKSVMTVVIVVIAPSALTVVIILRKIAAVARIPLLPPPPPALLMITAALVLVVLTALVITAGAGSLPSVTRKQRERVLHPAQLVIKETPPSVPFMNFWHRKILDSSQFRLLSHCHPFH
jgi:hypothetical protein